jgi:hypothetical protein
MLQLSEIWPHLSQLQATTSPMWCGGGNLHKECPEKENKENSVPRCCNCSLKEGERPHPSNYRVCSHAKEESLRRNAQRSAINRPAGRPFSSSTITPGQSYAAVLRTEPQQAPDRRKHQRPAANRAGTRSVSPGLQCKELKFGQYVQSSICYAADYDRTKWCWV